MGKHEAKSLLTAGHSQERWPSPYAGGYAEREGYSGVDHRSTERSRWLYKPSSKWQWSFMGIVLCQAVIALAIESYVFGEFQLHVVNNAEKIPSSRTIPTYLSLFIFGFVYEALLVYDALRLKNEIQVIGLCMYNVGLLIEAAVQFDQIQDATNSLAQAPAPNGGHYIKPNFWHQVHGYLIAVPAVIGLGTLLMSFVAWKLYREFEWSIIENKSADLRMRRRYLSYQIYIALLKFDFFFFLAFTVQFLVVVVHTGDVEFYITIAAVPVTIVLLFFAAYVVRRESVLGMVCIALVYFGALGYFLFKLIRMWDPSYPGVEDYVPSRHSLTTFAVITVLLLIVTIAYACICITNFDKGLKTYFASTRPRRRAASDEVDKLYADGVQVAGPGGTRWTID